MYSPRLVARAHGLKYCYCARKHFYFISNEINNSDAIRYCVGMWLDFVFYVKSRVESSDIIVCMNKWDSSNTIATATTTTTTSTTQHHQQQQHHHRQQSKRNTIRSSGYSANNTQTRKKRRNNRGRRRRRITIYAHAKSNKSHEIVRQQRVDRRYTRTSKIHKQWESERYISQLVSVSACACVQVFVPRLPNSTYKSTKLSSIGFSIDVYKI